MIIFFFFFFIFYTVKDVHLNAVEIYFKLMNKKILLHFYLKKKKIKINLCLILIKIIYYSLNFVCHCSQLDVNINNCFVCYSPFGLFCINNNNCLTDLSNGDLHSKFSLFKYTTFSHKSDWTFTDPIACLFLPFIWQCNQTD